jgi:hypothetical protein
VIDPVKKRTSMDVVRTSKHKQDQIRKIKANQDKGEKETLMSSLRLIARYIRAPLLDKEHKRRI